MYQDRGSSSLLSGYRYMLAGISLVLLNLASINNASAAGGYQIGAAANYSDNISRVPVDGTDDIVSNVNLSGLWSNESPRLNVSAFGQVTYLTYHNDTFSSEVIPRGNLNLDWNIIPARMTWIVEDRYGQIASDPFASYTPDNIEDINVLRTGPDFEFGSSPRQLLTISLRAEDQYYEVQPVDNQRLSAAVQLRRRLSDSRSIAITVKGEDVEFDDPGFGQDFSIIESFLTFEQNLAGSIFSVDVGKTQLDIDNQVVSGVLARLTGSRSFASYWFVRASGAYSYTDSGSRFLIGREQSSAGPGQTVDDDTLAAAGSPLRLRQFDISIAHDAARHSFDTLIYMDLETFEVTPELDREQFGAKLSYQFTINPLNTVQLSSSFRNVQFKNADRNDDNLEAELRYRRKLSRRLNLDLRVARFKRTSTDPTSVFEESVFGVSLSYASDLFDVLRRGTQ